MPVENDFEGHTTHADDPDIAEYDPALHITHDIDDEGPNAKEYVPWAQSTHAAEDADASAEEYDPALHITQKDNINAPGIVE